MSWSSADVQDSRKADVLTHRGSHNAKRERHQWWSRRGSCLGSFQTVWSSVFPGEDVPAESPQDQTGIIHLRTWCLTDSIPAETPRPHRLRTTDELKLRWNWVLHCICADVVPSEHCVNTHLNIQTSKLPERLQSCWWSADQWWWSADQWWWSADRWCWSAGWLLSPIKAVKQD